MVFTNHRFDPESSLLSRCRPAPEFIIRSIRYTNNEKPYKSYRFSKQEKAIMAAALDHLPDRLREMMDQKVVGIYLVENFWARGIVPGAGRITSERMSMLGGACGGVRRTG